MQSNPASTISELSWLVDNSISRELLTVPGVGQVQRSGGVAREIRLNLNPLKMEAVGVTAELVNAQVKAMNIDLPGGRSVVGGQEQSIRTLGSAADLETLRHKRIATTKGNTVAMIAGMTPIALGIGAGAEVRKSMAIAVIGGLTTSTLLTLVVVPVVLVSR